MKNILKIALSYWQAKVTWGLDLNTESTVDTAEECSA
jgi:hypothetical protein